MYTKLTRMGVSTLLVALAFTALPGQTQAASAFELEAQIKSLMEMVVKLQAQVAALHGGQQVGALKSGLREGMTDEDVKKVQEILASDHTIYPQGLITGYFGPLTRDALKRFQGRFGIAATGEVDSDTHDYLEELLNERFNGKIPPGLLRAPGIAKKVEDRMILRCDSDKVRGAGVLCKKLKEKHGESLKDDTGTTDDSDDSANDDDDQASDVVKKIAALIDGDETHVTVTYKDGNEDEFDYDVTREAKVIAEVADELNLSVNEVEDLIDFTDAGDVVESIKVEFEGSDSEVTVKKGDGTTDTFTLDYITKHNAVIEGIAEELDIDEDDVRDMIEFLDGELSIDVVTKDGDAEVDVTYENGSHESFVLHMDDEDDIVSEVIRRTELTEGEVEDVIDFNHK